MTGNLIKTLTQRRVGTATTKIDWNSLFAIGVDEIFTHRTWRFARKQINYIHQQGVFEKTFNGDAVELALNKPISVSMTTSYSIVGGAPVPVAGTALDLGYVTYRDFVRYIPEQTQSGTPECWTEIVTADGTNGLQIGLFPVPDADAAVWVWGDFKPVINLDGNQIPILPMQFHRLLLWFCISETAEEAGKTKLADRNRVKFLNGLAKLEEWDCTQPAYEPIRRPYNFGSRLGPIFPSNFPEGVARR